MNQNQSSLNASCKCSAVGLSCGCQQGTQLIQLADREHQPWTCKHSQQHTQFVICYLLLSSSATVFLVISWHDHDIWSKNNDQDQTKDIRKSVKQSIIWYTLADVISLYQDGIPLLSGYQPLLYWLVIIVQMMLYPSCCCLLLVVQRYFEILLLIMNLSLIN